MNRTATTRRAFVTGLAAAPLATPQRATRPNILLAIADDWGLPFASSAGDPVVKTPVFDRLAREGVLFGNAFVTAPSCSPSRASILTGQWHWRLEEGANLAGTLPAKYPVYTDLLESAGYHVGYTRKGWAPGEYAPGGRKRNPAGTSYGDFEAFLKARPQGTPFCFWFGSIDPHRKYDPDSGIRSGMNPADVKVPAYLPDNDTVRRDLCDYYFEVQRFDREVGQLLARIEQLGEAANTIIVITGDNGCPFPRAKANLYDPGTHVPLAVLWPERMKGGRRIDDFVSLSDLAPTFLEAAGLKPPAQMTGRSLLPVITGRTDRARQHVLTGMERHVPCRGAIKGGYPMRALRNQDFLYIRNFASDRWPAGDPNGLEVAGAKPFTYEQLEERTQHALADIDAGPTKAWLVTRRDEPGVKRHYDLAAGKRPERELYDLRKDPDQLTNVAAEPAYAKQVAKLDRQLMDELKRTGDPRASGGGDIFDSYAYRQRA